MSEDTHETLSAFIDGEVTGDAETRLLDKVLKDENLGRRWASYHLIGDVIRQHAHLHRQPEFSPAADDVRARAPRPAPAFISPVGGLALAASVALVAILGIQILSPEENDVVQTAAIESVAARDALVAAATTESRAEPGPISIPAQRVAAAASSMRSFTSQNWSDAAPAVATRLNGYLVTHNEHLSTGLGGIYPYARIVAYDGQGN